MQSAVVLVFLAGTAAALPCRAAELVQAGTGQDAAGAPGVQGAQEAGARGGRDGRRGEMAGMQRVMGEVSSVEGATLKLKATDGSVVEIITTENTRVREDRGPVKVSDLHPGDGLMALGNRDPNAPVLHAALIFAQTAAEIKAMRDNLGKTYITGRVTAIDMDNARMTVERADHVAQTIGFDETTSFKRALRGGGGSGGPGGNGSGGEGNGAPGGSASPAADEMPAGRPGGFGGGMGMGGMALGEGIDRAFSHGESITLADIKTGDTVAGTGALKDGVFVPTRLVDSPPRPHHQHPGSPEAPASAPTSSNPH